MSNIFHLQADKTSRETLKRNTLVVRGRRVDVGKKKTSARGKEKTTEREEIQAKERMKDTDATSVRVLHDGD